MARARRHQDIGETKNIKDAVPQMTWRARRYLDFGQPPNIKVAVLLQAVSFGCIATGRQNLALAYETYASNILISLAPAIQLIFAQ